MSNRRNFRNDISAVKKFADEHNIIFINNAHDIDPDKITNRYILFYEWTDGDELTFMIAGGLPFEDFIDEIIENPIVSISLDEYDITTNIIEVLYDKCVSNNII